MSSRTTTTTPGARSRWRTPGPNTGGSQFFINLVDNDRLDANYPVFGTVTAGMDVVDVIANVATDANNRPLTNVTILHAEIV